VNTSTNNLTTTTPATPNDDPNASKKKRKKKKKKNATTDEPAQPPKPPKPRPVFIDDPNWVPKVIPAGWGESSTSTSTSESTSAPSSSSFNPNLRSNQLPTGWDDNPVKKLLQEAIEKEELRKQKLAEAIAAGLVVTPDGLASWSNIGAQVQGQKTSQASTNITATAVNAGSSSNWGTSASTNSKPTSAPKAATGWDAPIVGVTFLSTGITPEMATQPPEPQEPWNFASATSSQEGGEALLQTGGGNTASKIEEIDD
jgi:hypothetical protein